MTVRLGLRGIRFHLAGSIPEGATANQAASIMSFVESFARAVMRSGGSLMHGSHPTFEPSLKTAAVSFASAGGSRDALTLVRTQKYASSKEDLAEIEAQRRYCAVQVVPSMEGDLSKSLVPVREWMAE